MLKSPLTSVLKWIFYKRFRLFIITAIILYYIFPAPKAAKKPKKQPPPAAAKANYESDAGESSSDPEDDEDRDPDYNNTSALADLERKSFYFSVFWLSIIKLQCFARYLLYTILW